ncbi:hypothetical protein [Desulfonatronospira sp.]|uniref:hypothetical protein n=1 Tax=Desulfonatronospira sp. TaxID=1962951 RepID=UPI0025C4C71C|nr:hypothetical protein [Desulfonatronospira sp.]
MQLQTMDVGNLEVVTNPYDLRRDLHTFMDYMISRQVKRTVRGNQLPKADAKRLARLMSMSQVSQAVEQYGYSPWLNKLDDIALNMGWTSYDTEGEYIGYTSQEPSFTDNYIKVNQTKYYDYCESFLQKQEDSLLQKLINSYSACNNEFFTPGLLGRLQPFGKQGCRTGVLPGINFAEIRRFLMHLLGQCPGDVWYSVDSFVRFLEAQHPFFLIPRHPKFAYHGNNNQDRYINFHERKIDDSSHMTISSKDTDGFKRVEGRYVERFLEGLPLMLGYVELAYAEPRPDIYPGLDQIRAFKLNDLFLRVQHKALPDPCVTVEPNFEIQVESQIYPVKTLRKLAPLTDCKRMGTVTTLKLNRKKVAAALAEDDSLDIKAMLKTLSGNEPPQNVGIELDEWAGQADAFILYSGFGLLEWDTKVPEKDRHVVESIDKGIDLVNNPDELFQDLEQAEHVPLLVSHGKGRLRPMPDTACTRFPGKRVAKSPAAKKESVVLKRSTEITLFFPDKQSYEIFRKEMLKAGCVFHPDTNSLGIRYLRCDQKDVDAALNSLKKHYRVKIQDLEK